jgi:hypothetical protein
MGERKHRPTGRKTRLTPEVQQGLCAAVALGVPLTYACDLVGVPYTTVSEWVARGEGRHPTRNRTRPYAEFAAALNKARAEDVVRRVARINNAACGGAVLSRRTTRTTTEGQTTTVVEERYAPPRWQADAWHLERRYPQEFGRRRPDSYSAEDIAELGFQVGRLALEFIPAERRAEFSARVREVVQSLKGQAARKGKA